MVFQPGGDRTLSRTIFKKRHNLNSLVSLVSHIIKRKLKALVFLELLIVGKKMFSLVVEKVTQK